MSINPDPNIKDVHSGYLADAFSRLYAKDYYVWERAVNLGTDKISPEVLLRALDILSMPRVSDTIPDKLKTKKGGCIPSGIAKYFERNYSAVKVDVEDPYALIELGGVVKARCDVEVYRVVVALIETSYSINQEVTNACKEMFIGILKQLQGETFVSRKQLTKIVVEVADEGNHYIAEIKRAILEMVGDVDEQGSGEQDK